MDRSEGIYLNFPNYSAGARGAFVIGGIDLGAILGNTKLPVGHASAILFSPDGEAAMYEYGRYSSTDDKLIGVPGKGNWRKHILPNRNKDESSQDYLRRIRHEIPEDYGSFTASFFNNVDYSAAYNYIN